MAYYLPTQDGSNYLILDALVDLLTAKCQTEVDTGDISRAALIKVGPLQASPESVTLLLHENDPFDPERWPNRPMKYRLAAPSGGLRGDPYTESESLRATPGRVLIGGGSLYSRAYLLEIEVFGLYMPASVDITRAVARKVMAVVSSRATKALLEAGPSIATGAQVVDDFGGFVVQGPFMDTSWTDPEESESLLIRVFLRFWYQMALDWSTNAW